MAKSFKDPEKITQVQNDIADALKRLTETAQKRFYDVIILDEIVFCFAKDLAKIEDIKELIEKRDPGVEIVMTGRDAPPELLEIADLVTEMKNIKHPFSRGISARRGIEF
jgi:cob(I)alamin adenosyltransferase